MNGPWSGVLVPPIGDKRAEWLEVAGANYEVTLEQVFLRDGRRIENQYAVVGLEPYGVVKSRYFPIQNREVLARARALTGEIAGLAALENGRRFIVVVNTGAVQSIHTAIVVQTSHDGTLPVTFAHVAHGYDYILARLAGVGDGSLRARHTPNLRDTIDEAKEVMAHHQEWREQMDNAITHHKAIPIQGVRRAVKAVVKKRADELADIVEALNGGKSWFSGAVAVSRALDVWPGYGDAEGRLLASLDERSLLSRHKRGIANALLG
jgi:hypothetical protein